MRVQRIIVPTAITLFWLIMMGLLVRNHVLPRPTAADSLEINPALLTERWEDYEEWMNLTVGGRSEGVSYTSICQLPQGEGYIAANRVRLALDLLGQRHDFRLQTVAALDSLFRLERAAAQVSLDESRLRFEALAEGLNFFYRLEYEGQSRVGSSRLDKPISLLEAVRPLLARRLDLAVGAVYRLPVLDSTWSLRQGWAEVRVEAHERVRVAGKPTGAYRLVFQLGPFSSTTWVTHRGEVLRREFANNIVMERTEREDARKRFPGIDDPIEMPKVERSDFRRKTTDGSAPDEEIGPLNLLGQILLKAGNPR